MSVRETDWSYMTELAAQRRQLKAEVQAHRLRVAREHLEAGYTSPEIAKRLRVSRDTAAALVAILKRGKS